MNNTNPNIDLKPESALKSGSPKIERFNFLRGTFLPVMLIIIALGYLSYKFFTENYRPDGKKVMVIGLDALDWDILNPLIDQGKVPNIARLIDEGTSGVLMSRPVTSSPVIWTTIATGMNREQHGITGFFASDEDNGRNDDNKRPVTSADRKVPALWNIMGVVNRTVACFGWWVTWPAEKVNGVMVSSVAQSDPVAFARRGVFAGDKIENLTYPETLAQEIVPYYVTPDSITHDDLNRIVNVDDWEHPMFELERVGPSVDYVLPWTMATDFSYLQIAEHILTKKKYDLTMIYFQGTDTTGHRFWSFREKSDVLKNTLEYFDLLPEEEETYRRYFGEAMENYYVLADEFVGRLLKLVDDKTVVIICSDHGFGPADFENDERWVGHTFSGSHRDAGSIIIWGPGIRKGKKLDNENPPYIWDVAPTVFAILDVPLAEDMPGKPITDAFDARFMQDYQPQFVVSYNINYQRGEVPQNVPMTDEYMERLRSLGYIQ